MRVPTSGKCKLVRCRRMKGSRIFIFSTSNTFVTAARNLSRFYEIPIYQPSWQVGRLAVITSTKMWNMFLTRNRACFHHGSNMVFLVLHSIYVSRSQLGHVCRRGIIFKKLGICPLILASRPVTCFENSIQVCN